MGLRDPFNWVVNPGSKSLSSHCTVWITLLYQYCCCYVEVMLHVVHIRAVPTIFIAHVFCASRDTRVFLSVMLTNTVIFLPGLKLSIDLCKYQWYPKRKYGVTMHFWEIIIYYASIWEGTPYIALYFKAFYKYCCNYQSSLKNAWLPPIFFLDFNSTC